MANDTEDRGGSLPRVGIAILLLTVISLAAAGAAMVLGAEQDKRGPADMELTARQVEGRELFTQNCSQCHTLGGSNAIQTVGPNLDALKPPAALTLDAIEKGRARGQGNMPAGLVRGEDAQAVADYVAAVAGKAKAAN